MTSQPDVVFVQEQILAEGLRFIASDPEEEEDELQTASSNATRTGPAGIKKGLYGGDDLSPVYVSERKLSELFEWLAQSHVLVFTFLAWGNLNS